MRILAFFVFCVLKLSICSASCIHPGSPKYGRLGNSSQIKFPREEYVDYICEEGHVLFGEAKRLCTKFDKWEPDEVPQCLNNLVAVKNDLKIQHNRDGSAEVLKSFDKDYCQSIGDQPYIWNVTLLESALVTNLEVRFKQTPEQLAPDEIVGKGSIVMEAWMETPEVPDAPKIMCSQVYVPVPMVKNNYQVVCNGTGSVVNLKMTETMTSAVTVDICTIAVLSPDTMPPRLCYNPNNKDINISTMKNMCFYINTKRFNSNNSALMCNSIGAAQLTKQEVLKDPSIEYFVLTFLSYVKKDIEVFFQCPPQNKTCASFIVLDEAGKHSTNKAADTLPVLCKSPPIHCGIPKVEKAAKRTQVVHN